jgi:hypothetical protein
LLSPRSDIDGVKRPELKAQSTRRCRQKERNATRERSDSNLAAISGAARRRRWTV